MAVKRSMKKTKAAPIKRSIKRASPVDEFIDADVGKAEMADIKAQEEVEAEIGIESPDDDMGGFHQAPLRPEQQAEKDALEGSNAAARASNNSLEVRQSIADKVRGFQERNKSKAAYNEFMALSPEERAVILDEEQRASKAKRGNK